MVKRESDAVAVFQPPVRIEVRDGNRSWIVEYDGTSLLSIGRGEDCSVVLTTTKSSRKHAEVFGEGGRLTLLDAGSANGTRVNGVPADRVVLKPGDEVQIGEASLKFRSNAPTVATAQRDRPAAARTPQLARGAGVLGATASASAAAAVETFDKSPAPAVTAAPAARRKSRVWLNAVVPLVLLSLVCVGILLNFKPSASNGSPGGAGTDASGAPSYDAVVTGAPPDEGSDAAGVPTRATVDTVQKSLFGDPLQARTDLVTAVDDAQKGEFGWDAAEIFESLEKLHPGTYTADEAQRIRRVLEGVKKGVTEKDRNTADSALKEMLSDKRYGDATIASRFLGRTAADVKEREYWEQRRSEVQAQAHEEFLRVEKDLGDLLAAGRAADALRGLVEVRQQFSGTEYFDELLPRYVESGLRPEQPPEEDMARAQEAAALLERANAAFEECRYRDLVPIFYRYLSLDPPERERIDALERLVESYYLQQMFEAFLEGVAGKPVEVRLGEHGAGKVVRATAAEVEYEVDMGGASYKEVFPWVKISPPKKFALFEGLVYGRDTMLGLAFFAHRIGYDEGVHHALLRLKKRKEAEDLVNAVMAHHMGIAVPNDGFVEYRGRLVTPEVRASEIARREQLAMEEKARREELKRMKRSNDLMAYVDWAKLQRTKGNFDAAQNVLIAVAEQGKETEAGVEARRLVDDPVLATYVMSERGRAENRLGFVFLGDGYPIEDDYQAAFKVSCNTCMKLLLNAEPYKEYQSYFNFKSVHIGSRDRGLDLIERKVERDTPLGGRVEWGVFTADNSAIMQILDRLDGKLSDRQAIVIGNEYADVATGGGGVTCMVKGMVSVVGHETGHSIAALRDEYDFPAGNDPNRPIAKKREASVPTLPLPPNLMQGSNREDVLAKTFWKYWIDAGEKRWWNGTKVGVFEGGNYTPFNVWRPQSDCTMRNAGSRFCVVCMEQMVLSFYRYVRPIDKVEPEAPEIELGQSQTLHVKVWPMKPEKHFLDATWSLLELAPDDELLIEQEVEEEEEEDEDGGSRTGVVKKKKQKLDSAKDERKGEIFKRVFRTIDPEGRVLEVAELRSKDLRTGIFRLRLEIADPTPWVLKDDQGLLKQRRDWIVRVVRGGKKK